MELTISRISQGLYKQSAREWIVLEYKDTEQAKLTYKEIMLWSKSQTLKEFEAFRDKGRIWIPIELKQQVLDLLTQKNLSPNSFYASKMTTQQVQGMTRKADIISEDELTEVYSNNYELGKDDSLDYAGMQFAIAEVVYKNVRAVVYVNGETQFETPDGQRFKNRTAESEGYDKDKVEWTMNNWFEIVTQVRDGEHWINWGEDLGNVEYDMLSAIGLAKQNLIELIESGEVKIEGITERKEQVEQRQERWRKRSAVEPWISSGLKDMTFERTIRLLKTKRNYDLTGLMNNEEFVKKGRELYDNIKRDIIEGKENFLNIENRFFKEIQPIAELYKKSEYSVSSPKTLRMQEHHKKMEKDLLKTPKIKQEGKLVIHAEEVELKKTATGEWDESDEDLRSWREELEKDVKEIERLTNKKLEFISSHGFDVYQGPYARVKINDKGYKIWTIGSSGGSLWIEGYPVDNTSAEGMRDGFQGNIKSIADMINYPHTQTEERQERWRKRSSMNKKAEIRYYYGDKHEVVDDVEKYTVFKVDSEDHTYDGEGQIKALIKAKEMGMGLAGGEFGEGSEPHDIDENYTVVDATSVTAEQVAEYQAQTERTGQEAETEAKKGLLCYYDESKMQDEEVEYIKKENILDKDYIFDDDADIMKIYEKVKDVPYDQGAVETFWRLLKDAGLDRRLEKMIQQSVWTDSDLLNFGADNFFESFTEALKERNPDGEWYIKGEHMGWRDLSGEATVEAKDSKEFLEKVGPRTSDITIYVYDYMPQKKGLKIKMYHHDAPTGETYYALPVKGTDLSEVEKRQERWRKRSALRKNAYDEKKAAIEHYQKYEDLAQKIGVEDLKQLVPKGYDYATKSHEDEYLNNVPIKLWDTRDPLVRQLIRLNRESGITGWSLSDTVCLLKHVAKYYVANIKPPIDLPPTPTEQRQERWRRRSSLNKKAEYENLTTQTSDVPKELVDQIKEIQSGIDKSILIDTEDEKGWVKNGLQLLFHITVLYGVKPKDKERLSETVKEFMDNNEITAKTNGIDYFDNEEKKHTAIVVRIESEKLKELHDKLKKEFDNEDKYPEYKAHTCIAYVKLGERLEGVEIKPVAWNIDKIEMSNKDGSLTKVSAVDMKERLKKMQERKDPDGIDENLMVIIHEAPTQQTTKAIDRLNPIPSLWYENEDGDKYVPTEEEMKEAYDVQDKSKDYPYQHSRFPVLTDSICIKNAPPLLEGETGINCIEPIVLYLVIHNGWDMVDAITVGATACERCLNILLEETTGEPYEGRDTAGTHCELCAMIDPEYEKQWNEKSTPLHEMVKESSIDQRMLKAQAIADYFVKKYGAESKRYKVYIPGISMEPNWTHAKDEKTAIRNTVVFEGKNEKNPAQGNFYFYNQNYHDEIGWGRLAKDIYNDYFNGGGLSEIVVEVPRKGPEGSMKTAQVEEFTNNMFVIFTQDCKFKMDQMDAVGEIKENMIGKVSKVTDDGILVDIGKQSYEIPFLDAYKILEPFRAKVVSPEAEGQEAEGEGMPKKTPEPTEEGEVPEEMGETPTGARVRPEIGTERGMGIVPIKGPRKPLEKALEVETVLINTMKKLAIEDPRKQITKGTKVTVNWGGKEYNGTVVKFRGNSVLVALEDGSDILLPLESIELRKELDVLPTEKSKIEMPKEKVKVEKRDEKINEMIRQKVGVGVEVSLNVPGEGYIKGTVISMVDDKYTVMYIIPRQRAGRVIVGIDEIEIGFYVGDRVQVDLRDKEYGVITGKIENLSDDYKYNIVPDDEYKVVGPIKVGYERIFPIQKDLREYKEFKATNKMIITADELDKLIYAKQSVPEILDGMAGDENWLIRYEVAQHPEIKPETLDKLAKDPDARVRTKVAKNPNASEETLVKLRYDKDEDVIEALVLNTKFPMDMKVKMVGDASPYIRETLASLYDIPQEVLIKLSTDENEGVRSSVAIHPFTPINILQVLAFDKNDYVREMVVNNPSVTREILELIINNPKETQDIKNLAQEKMNQIGKTSEIPVVTSAEIFEKNAREVNFFAVPATKDIRERATITVLPCIGERAIWSNEELEDVVPYKIENRISAKYIRDFDGESSIVRLSDGKEVLVKNEYILVDEYDIIDIPIDKGVKIPAQVEQRQERWRKRSNQGDTKMEKIILSQTEISDQMLDKDGMWLSKELWEPEVKYHVEQIESLLGNIERGVNVVGQIATHLDDLEEILEKIPSNQIASAGEYLQKHLQEKPKVGYVVAEMVKYAGDDQMKKPLKELNKIIKKRDKDYVKMQKNPGEGKTNEPEKGNTQPDINFSGTRASLKLSRIVKKANPKVKILVGVNQGEVGEQVETQAWMGRPSTYKVRVGNEYYWYSANEIESVEESISRPTPTVSTTPQAEPRRTEVQQPRDLSNVPSPKIPRRPEDIFGLRVKSPFPLLTAEVSAGFKLLLDEIEHASNPYVVSDIGKRLYKKENKELEIVREGKVSR